MPEAYRPCPLESHDGTLATLSDDALVALALCDAPHRSAAKMRLARALDRIGDIGSLADATPARLCDALGVSSRRALQFAAACELTRRARWAGERSSLRFLRSQEDVARWARPRLLPLAHEELWLLALDARCGFRAARKLARGGRSGLSVAACDVLRAALLEGAAAFVLVHNHPSGDPTPSCEDRVMSARIAAAADACGLSLVDHVVVASSGHASALEPTERVG